MSNNRVAIELARKTQDAFSFQFYKIDLWQDCTEYLLKCFSYEVAEEILRSKYMRWCHEQFESGTYEGKLEEFKVFIQDNVESIFEMLFTETEIIK